ncbi:M91 family zinc metallopeptidase [Microbacterium sp.]|uniref:M91 family zinc metallopeptidase n=1 Tax=Microbacterium sp. TaxID=51671 RepID=UPI003F9E4085
MNLDTSAVNPSTLVPTQQQYWDGAPLEGGEKFAEAPLRSETSAPIEAVRDSATDGAVAIAGSDTGSSLPGKTTPDGKNIRNAELHQGEQATVTREQTQAGSLFNSYISSDQVVFTTSGQGDDHVQISQRDDGTLDIDVNGEVYEVRLTERQELTIRTGDGNDVIEAAANVTVNMVVDAGAGDDHIVTGMGDDRIQGGDGNDFIQTIGGRNDIDGGSGDDVIHGGDGANVIYGGRGNDEIHAGSGFNHIDGGRGDDVIHGAGGENIISAGNGSDQVNLAGGSNTVYTGDGQSRVEGAGAGDTVYATVNDLINSAGAASPTVVNVEIDPELGRSIEVTGSDAFQQRMEAELDFLRASPAGQQMLAELDAAAEKGNVVTIRELANEQNGYAQTMGRGAAEISNGQAGDGSDVLVSYNPSFHMDAFPTSNVVLFHELSHAYNGVTGTFQPGTYVGEGPDSGRVPNAERQAVGLETSADPFDFDGDPSTPPTTHNPMHLTENGIRREMGLPDRPSYAL